MILALSTENEGVQRHMIDNLDDIIIRNMLERHAAEQPDDEFLFFPDGSSWTRADALEAAIRAANVLRDLGVRQGDRVAIFLPNGEDFLRAWWGASFLGAVVVPINVSYRGSMLAGIVNLAQPVLLITDDELGARLGLDSITVTYTRVDASQLPSGSLNPITLERPLFFGDKELLVTTSGTTGPSKLVATTYLHNFLGGSHFVNDHGRGADERVLVDLPLYHSAAIYMVTAALSAGARLIVRESPAMSNYWEVARETGATMAVLLSSMIPFLQSQPEREADRLHGLRAILVAPIPADAAEFLKRFGIEEMYTACGSTETPGAIVGAVEVNDAKFCGRERKGFSVRLVDENDIEVPVGEPGELTIRPDVPWSMMAGYEDNYEATAAAWRNGWFHTGDSLVRDEEGRFFFVDRIKDALRRRGENISSAEVEAEVRSHPSVQDVACVPCRLDGVTDDEVKVWVVPADGEVVDPRALFEYCVDRMPHFMVPRFIEITEEFPKTASQRVRKFELRERGNGPQTWDSEAHGLRVTRQGIKQLDGV